MFSKSLFGVAMMLSAVANLPIATIHERATLAPLQRQARRRSTTGRGSGATRVRLQRLSKLGRRLRRKHELGRAGAF